MQRRIATWLLFIFLFANSELHELVKVGAFVVHYQEHLTESPGLSLLEFIQIHYSSEVVYDEDYSRDMQLPFKTADCISLSAPCTVPPIMEPQLCSNPAPAGVKLLHNFEFVHTAQHLSDIWQPPKQS